MRSCAPRLAGLALLFLAAAALAAQVEVGDVQVVPQAPFSNLTVIGLSGEGSLTIDAGTQATLPAVAMGGLETGIGTLTITGSGSKLTTTGDTATRANTVAVGGFGTGTLEVLAGGALELDGTSNLPGDLAPGFGVAIYAGSVGTATLSGEGSLLEIKNGDADSAGLAVGVDGDGSLALQGGADIHIDTGTGENSGLSVGNGEGSTGDLAASGAGSTIELSGEGRGLTVGNAGTGTLGLSEGAELTGAQVAFLGLTPTSEGTVRVESGGRLEIADTNPLLGFGGSLNVGLAGTGRLEVEGGEVVLDNQDGALHGILVGGTIGCGGACPYTGGSGEIAVGPGGSVTVLGPLGGATVGADGEGSLEISGGGSFVIENPDGQGGITVGATPGSTGSVLVQGVDSRLDAGIGLLAGLDLALADAGSATLTLADGGTLEVGTLTLGTLALLRGNGFVQGNVSNLRGSVAPGGSVGSLDVDGTFQSAGTLRIELAGTAADRFDVLRTTGPLQLLGGVVDVDLLGGFLPRSGDEIQIGEAPGGVSVDPSVATSYRGAAPGFDFEVVADGQRGGDQDDC